MSNALEMYKKIPLASTFGFSSKADCISCIIDSSWSMHESPGRKPDWENAILLCLKVYHAENS